MAMLFLWIVLAILAIVLCGFLALRRNCAFLPSASAIRPPRLLRSAPHPH